MKNVLLKTKQFLLSTLGECLTVLQLGSLLTSHFPKAFLAKLWIFHKTAVYHFLLHFCNATLKRMFGYTVLVY